MNTQLTDMEVIHRYKQVAMRMLRLSFPQLGDKEISDAVDISIMKRMKDSEISIHNNYKDKTVNTTLLEMANYILTREPIITASGCMFKKHGECPNPLYSLIQTFIDRRNEYKKEMFKYPKGSEQYQKYNLLQLLAKIDSNAIYGCLGNYSALYYNLYVATSITTMGKSAIASSLVLFESFLANNIKFGSLNEIITFIDNVVTEERTYDDSIMLDSNITLSEAYYKIMSTCGFEYTPSEKDMFIVWEIMMQLKPGDFNRLFYKNNLYSFCDNKTVTKAIEYILTRLEKPFLNPNKPPKEIKVELDELLAIFKEYVFYQYQIIDKLDRVEMMIRDVVLIVDTDSCIVSLDAWYRYTLEKVYNVPMEIKRQLIDPTQAVIADEFGDKELIRVVERVEDTFDYDFYSDEVIEVEKLMKPYTIVPQDGLRHSIINIVAYCLGQLILDYMKRYAKNYNSHASNRDCLLVMKNEFLFKRLLLTDGKKNYAAIQELQEGHPVPKDKSLNITGMSIDKATLQDKTRERLTKILYEDILNAPNIDQLQVLKSIVKTEKDIYDSLLSGKKEYYKPIRIKPLANYDNPMRIQGIKGSIVYNALRDENTEAINLEKRNSVDIVKVNIDRKTVESIKETYPDKYSKILELMKVPEFSTGIDAVSLPTNVDVPEWVLEFVDYTNIINDNVKNFPMESIGLCRLDNANINYTNILKI